MRRMTMVQEREGRGTDRGWCWFPTHGIGGSSVIILIAVLALSAGGCKKNKWILGQWLHIDEDGKPGACHEFADKRKLTVYRSGDCKGPADPMLSGRWQLKEEHRLAILRTGEGEAHLALISEHDETHFVSRGGLAGSFHRLDDATKPEALVAKLREKGVVKRHQLTEAQGCKQLSLSVDSIRALPKEEKPRMLRSRDQGLEYHADNNTGDPMVEKIVYALNQEQLDWVAFHLTPGAYAAPGPEARLDAILGKPETTLTTGTGQQRQNIVMWRAYCADVRGAFNKDVDITLFSTAGERQGLYYLSEGIIAGLWADLEQTIATSPPADEEQGAGDQATQEAPAAATAPAPKAATPPTPSPAAPAQAKPAPAAKPAPTPSPPPATPKAAKEQPTGRLAVPGDEDI